MSGGVLIIGTWLATDKASFIDLTLNNLTLSKYGPASSINNQDAEIILKVMGLVQSHCLYNTGGIIMIVDKLEIHTPYPTPASIQAVN